MRKIFIYILIILFIFFGIPVFFTHKRNLVKEVDKREEIQDISIEKYDYGKYNKIKLLHNSTR